MLVPLISLTRVSGSARVKTMCQPWSWACPLLRRGRPPSLVGERANSLPSSSCTAPARLFFFHGQTDRQPRQLRLANFFPEFQIVPLLLPFAILSFHFQLGFKPASSGLGGETKRRSIGLRSLSKVVFPLADACLQLSLSLFVTSIAWTVQTTGDRNQGMVVY